MAQQIQGGGVTFDAGVGVREAGRNISDAGMQLLQNMTARKNTMVQAAEQARVAFFNNAQLTGMTPQQYASTVGAAEYKRMVEAQGQAANAETVFGNFLKSNKVDSQSMLENFNNFENLTQESRMRMNSNNIDVQNHFAVDANGQPIQPQSGNNAPQNLQGAAQNQGGQQGQVVQQQPQAAPAQQLPVEALQAYVASGQPVTGRMPIPANLGNALAGESMVAPQNYGVAPARPTVAGNMGDYLSNPAGAPADPGASLPNPTTVYNNLFNNTPEGRANLQAMRTAGTGMSYTPPVAPPPKPLTVEQQLAGAPDNIKVEARKIDSAKAVEKAAAEKIAAETQKAQLAAKGIDGKKTPTLEALITAKGTERVEKADNATLAKEILDVQDAAGLQAELLESSKKVFPTGDVTQPAVPLGATPFAEKAIAHNVEKTNASTDAVITKGEELLSKASTGYKITDKDIAAFKQMLDANKGNYAKTLSQLDPQVSKAISERAIAEVMSMDSTRMQIAGLTDVASRKAAQEQLANSLAIVTKQMEQKATGMRDLGDLMNMVTKQADSVNEKIKILSDGGKKSYEKILLENPELKSELNSIELLRGQIMMGGYGLKYDPIVLSEGTKPGFLWIPKKTIVSSTYGEQANQMTQDAARQGAVATPKSTAGTDYINKKF